MGGDRFGNGGGGVLYVVSHGGVGGENYSFTALKSVDFAENKFFQKKLKNGEKTLDLMEK